MGLSSKGQQEARDRELAELYELLEQLMDVHEALLQDRASLGALHGQLSAQYQALREEHSRHKALLRGSLEMESKAFRLRWVPVTVGVTCELSTLRPPVLWPLGVPLSRCLPVKKTGV